MTDECLRKFSLLANLEELILAKCPAVSGEAVLSLINACPKLQRVAVQGNTNIREQLVFSAVDAVKRRQLQLKREGKPVSKEPLLLYIAKTSINNLILSDEKYQATTSLVKVSFDTPFVYMAMDIRSPTIDLDSSDDDLQDLFDEDDDAMDNVFGVFPQHG